MKAGALKQILPASRLTDRYFVLLDLVETFATNSRHEANVAVSPRPPLDSGPGPQNQQKKFHLIQDVISFFII